MKCLEGYTVEQVKAMDYDELKDLWDDMLKEKHTIEMRSSIVEILEIIEAKKPMIEG